MPRNAKSNGIPPQVRALAVIKLGVPVTPSEINKCVDTGNYASKWILYLKIMGFEFEVKKDGRNVVSYTMISEPKNAAELRAMQPKVSNVKKPAKVAEIITVVPKKPFNNLAKIKAAAEKLAAKTGSGIRLMVLTLSRLCEIISR
jgi:hypothetical protein